MQVLECFPEMFSASNDTFSSSAHLHQTAYLDAPQAFSIKMFHLGCFKHYCIPAISLDFPHLYKSLCLLLGYLSTGARNLPPFPLLLTSKFSCVLALPFIFIVPSLMSSPSDLYSDPPYIPSYSLVELCTCHHKTKHRFVLLSTKDSLLESKHVTLQRESCRITLSRMLTESVFWVVRTNSTHTQRGGGETEREKRKCERDRKKEGREKETVMLCEGWRHKKIRCWYNLASFKLTENQ